MIKELEIKPLHEKPIRFAASKGRTSSTVEDQGTYYMDDSVTGNIVQLLYNCGLQGSMEDALRVAPKVSLYVKLGTRWVDLRLWAVEGRIKDYEFWKGMPAYIGYRKDAHIEGEPS